VGEAAMMIANGLARPVDLMRVRYTSHDGLPTTRLAINVTSFGMGGIVAARSNRFSKWLGGKAPYLIATTLTAAWHAGSRVTLAFDRMDPIEARVTNVVIGNGQYQGAGMRVCPDAKFDDGRLDVTVIRHLNGFEIVRDIRMLYDGKILQHPKVSAYRVRHIRAASPDTTFVEIDGEPLGRLPLEIEVIPGAIRVVTGVGS
jgi:diacylglycerol kinase (ATP)